MLLRGGGGPRPVSSAQSLAAHTGGLFLGPRNLVGCCNSTQHLTLPLLAWHPGVPSRGRKAQTLLWPHEVRPSSDNLQRERPGDRSGRFRAARGEWDCQSWSSWKDVTSALILLKFHLAWLGQRKSPHRIAQQVRSGRGGSGGQDQVHGQGQAPTSLKVTGQSSTPTTAELAALPSPPGTCQITLSNQFLRSVEGCLV